MFTAEIRHFLTVLTAAIVRAQAIKAMLRILAFGALSARARRTMIDLDSSAAISARIVRHAYADSLRSVVEALISAYRAQVFACVRFEFAILAREARLANALVHANQVDAFAVVSAWIYFALVLLCLAVSARVSFRTLALVVETLHFVNAFSAILANLLVARLLRVLTRTYLSLAMFALVSWIAATNRLLVVQIAFAVVAAHVLLAVLHAPFVVELNIV
jgi:hypothetical protein